MLWFNKEKRKKMEFIQNYVPTSKAQLLQVSMYFNNGDIQKAQEMFDYYAKNLDLPDFDPVSPTFMQQVKSNATDFFSWMKENQDDIVKGYQLIHGIIKNKGELPSMVGDTPVEPLPNINE
jgi:hypothetical protein